MHGMAAKGLQGPSPNIICFPDRPMYELARACFSWTLVNAPCRRIYGQKAIHHQEGGIGSVQESGHDSVII